MNAIAFTGVSKSYGPVRAVEGLDLTIDAGSTVALLGPNGAGKSTSIGMLLGLVRPSAGEIRVFGDSPDTAVKQGRVGAMLQDGTLVPGLTVREVVSFIRGLYPDPMPLEEILALAGLTDLAGRRADRLSGGQAQRVRFAIAIAGAPRLLVLDEPTAAMDVESRRSFWGSMREYAATGRTILFATHYLEEADENADRVIVVARGRVVADGTPNEIKAAVGTGTVRFTIGDQPTAGLDALPGVTGVEIRGSVAQLRTTSPDATVQALYATGLRVTDLEVRGADLEEAFLSLTHDN
ncbi:ABC transporter ATP-binding protein [Actinoallomurus purpureus]|uniref:ABC transporter ATP-binding protein n=1 Tax=Actinoallomurus purpureus TaxID=478114 RepID=UPI0020926C83|nr:ABC transporter ATP-binding protein [Actinoallomurus purpureus]MCO6009352.1 ABC transporter ATP-binding protein [Actinoallomurus purpureus]